MGVPSRTGTLVGLDIGRVNTRVAVFGIEEGKYRLQGSQIAGTDFGYEGHLASGVHEALGGLEQFLDRKFLLSPDQADGLPSINHRAVDRVGLTLSAFPPIRAVLFGLTASGSLAAGSALTGKLPLELAGTYGLADLADEAAVIDQVLSKRPHMLLLTGGTDMGAEESLARWVEVACLICRILPENVRPVVFFAGNPGLEDLVRRRLEPYTRLVVLPNLQPACGEWDDIPSHLAITREVMVMSSEKLAGLQGLTRLTGGLVATRGAMLERMVRFLCRAQDQHLVKDEGTGGILTLDLGAGSTMICAGRDGRLAASRVSARHEDLWAGVDAAVDPIHQWTAARLSRESVGNEFANQQLFPGRFPQSLTELAFSQSLARYRIRAGMAALAEQADSFPYDTAYGLMGEYGRIIASGAALTNAPTPGQAMLMLLDGLQPWRQSTLVLDRFHILPLLGLLGEVEPLLPVHILASDAFDNLGTVIPVISQVPDGVMVLSITVNMDSGKTYQVDIPQGVLRRLIAAPGESVTLILEPAPEADVGAGPGVSRQVRVTGGPLGVVIDARGRPLRLPENDDERVDCMRHWLGSLGG